MSLSVKHIENLDFLHLEVSGSWSYEDGQRIFTEISSHLSPGHRGRVLIDTRTQVRDTSTLAVYNEAKDIASSLLGYRIRIAILSSPEIDPPNVFLETVARNRGVDLMVFLAMNDAVEWLMGNIPKDTTDPGHA